MFQTLVVALKIKSLFFSLKSCTFFHPRRFANLKFKGYFIFFLKFVLTSRVNLIDLFMKQHFMFFLFSFLSEFLTDQNNAINHFTSCRNISNFSLFRKCYKAENERGKEKIKVNFLKLGHLELKEGQNQVYAFRN